MPTTADYVTLAEPLIALATGVYKRFGNLVKATMWSDLCQCNPAPGALTCTFPILAGHFNGTENDLGGDYLGLTFTVARTGVSCKGFVRNWVANVDYGGALWDNTAGALVTRAAAAASGTGQIEQDWTDGPHALTNGHVYTIYYHLAAGGSNNFSNPTVYIPPADANATYGAWKFGLNTDAEPPVRTPSSGFDIVPVLCVGASGTIPPDPTPPTPPTGFPTYPGPAACGSFNDVCAAIGLLQSQLAAVADEVRLLRNYQVPFGLVNGTDHAGLSGSGSFSIGGVIGFRIRVTSGSGSPVLAGNPPYVMNQGWVSIDDGSGMYAEKRVTQTSFLWLPSNAQLATSFNWAFEAGITVDVLELLAEP